METMETPTPADLRADVARYQLFLYEIAPRVRMNPQRLGAFLCERIPMRPEMATKIASAIADAAAERRSLR
jgi:hypothetical protein